MICPATIRNYYKVFYESWPAYEAPLPCDVLVPQSVIIIRYFTDWGTYGPTYKGGFQQIEARERGGPKHDTLELTVSIRFYGENTPLFSLKTIK